MSTSTTSSHKQPSITKGQRSKRMDELCKKYIKNLLYLPSLDSLKKHFGEQDINDAELTYASEQMTDYAQSELWESLSNLFEEEGVYERLNHIDALGKHKEEDYESVYTNSINRQSGEDGDKLQRILPNPAQVSYAELYRLKRKELDRLHALRDSLRLENKTKMEELSKKKQTRQELMATPILAFTPPQLEPS